MGVLVFLLLYNNLFLISQQVFVVSIKPKNEF